MYLGSFIIDDTCCFYANAHTPSTGAAVDADAVPGYRIYEDETGTPILTGTMALLDDANTVGFYSEQITLSAANGFEAGKSYCVRVTIVVGGVTGVERHALQIGARVDARMLAGGVQSATDLKDFADDGYDPATNKVEGVKLADTLTTYTGNTVQTGDSFARIGVAGAGLTNIDLPNQTMDITGNLSGSVGSVTGAVGSVTGAVGSVTGLTAADVGAIKAKTDNLPSDPADASVVAGLIAGVDAKVDTVDTVVDAILVDTGTTLDGRIPAALVGGRIDASVGAMAAAVVTAAAVATGAIDADAIAADAVTEIQAGLATPTNITAGIITTVTTLTNSGHIKKNTALAAYAFLMTDSTNHAPATGLAVTVTRSIDGGAFGAGALSAVTEVGVGIYVVDFAAGDLNGNVIVLRATAALSDDTFERIVTSL